MSGQAQRLEVLLQLKRYEQLLAEATQALGENQENHQAGLYQLMALIHQEDYDTALERANALQATCGFDSFFWSLKSDIALALKQFDLAESAARQALSIHPNSALNLSTLGYVLMAKEQLAEAQRYFEKALNINPHYHQAWLYLAILYGTFCFRKDIARAYLQEFLAQDPHHEWALELLAEYQTAPWHQTKIWRQILALNPLNQDIASRYQNYQRQTLRLVWIALVLFGLAWLSHGLPEAIGLPLKGLVVVAGFIVSVWLFRWQEKWPGILLVLLVWVTLHPPNELNLISFLLSAVLGGMLTLIAYSVHRFFGQRSTKP